MNNITDFTISKISFAVLLLPNGLTPTGKKNFVPLGLVPTMENNIPDLWPSQTKDKTQYELLLVVFIKNYTHLIWIS